MALLVSAIVGFTYYKNYRSIEEFSDKTIELASQTILENVSCLFVGTKELVQSSAGGFLTPKSLSWDRPQWASYLLSVVHHYPHLPAFYVATTEGSYIYAGDLKLTVQSHFLSDPHQPLPKEAAYIMQFFKREGEGMAYYYDENLKEVAREPFAAAGYDPRQRPWYIGAEKGREVYWSDVYLYYDRPDLGFTLSYPLFNRETKEMMGVVAADFSFKLLSEFFLKQKIGISGRAYILDGQGKILIPEKASAEEGSLIAEAMEVFSRDKDSYFLFEAKDNHDYLVHITHLPVITGHDWKIAIIVPFADFFSEFVRSNQQSILIIFGIALIAMLVIIYFAKLLSDPIVLLSKEIDQIRQLNLASEMRVDSNIKEIHLIDQSIASMRYAFRSFIRYVPKEIVKQLLEKQERIALGGEKKRIALFFSDIAGFTGIAESLPSEQLMPLLEEYFEGMSKRILESKGMVDKYIGDGIMAFWGAPLEIDNPAKRSCLAALQCRGFVRELNARRKKEQKPEFRTRMGIDVGVVIVGNIGTEDRMNYTAIGDAVTFASHLEQLNKTYRTEVIISESTQKELNEQFLLRPLDDVNGAKVYELMDDLEKEGKWEREKELCRRFTQGYEMLAQRNPKGALEIFEMLHRDFPEDEPTRIYLERCKGDGK